MKLDFTFSDTLAGYVIEYNSAERWYTVETSDKRVFKVNLIASTYARTFRNLEEPYQDASGVMNDLLATPGQFVYSYGTYYPAADGGDAVFEVQWIIFPSTAPQNTVMKRRIGGSIKFLPLQAAI
jgi:hypothetical protein